LGSGAAAVTTAFVSKIRVCSQKESTASETATADITASTMAAALSDRFVKDVSVLNVPQSIALSAST